MVFDCFFFPPTKRKFPENVYFCLSSVRFGEIACTLYIFNTKHLSLSDISMFSVTDLEMAHECWSQKLLADR